MSLTSKLPSRPLSLDEVGLSEPLPGLRGVTPFYMTTPSPTGQPEEIVIACLLSDGTSAELVGFDPDATEWKKVSLIPDMGEISAAVTSREMIDTWVFEHYARENLVQAQVNIDNQRKGKSR